MTSEELSMLNLTRELMAKDRSSPIHLFLKYSPDTLKKLFDFCVVKPSYVQVRNFSAYRSRNL